MNQKLEQLMKENNMFSLKNFFVFMGVNSQKDWNNLLLSRDIFVNFWVDDIDNKIWYDLDQDLNHEVFLLLKGYYIIKNEKYLIDYETNTIKKSSGKKITKLYHQHLKETNQKVSLVEFDKFVNRVEKTLFYWYTQQQNENEKFNFLTKTYQQNGIDFIFDDEVWLKLRQIDYDKNNLDVYIEINDVCDVFLNKKELYERFDLKQNTLNR